MFRVPQTTTYGILACLCLQRHDQEWLVAEKISASTDVPLPYLSKVLQTLTGSGILEAKRGYRGGFRLARPASEISIMDIVESTDGRSWDVGCVLGLAACSEERPCPAHDFWHQKRRRIESGLRQISFADASWDHIAATMLAEPESSGTGKNQPIQQEIGHDPDTT